MLVIARREGESFFIGNDIEIVIVKSGSTVRVGIQAARDVTVVRTELIPLDELEPIEE